MFNHLTLSLGPLSMKLSFQSLGERFLPWISASGNVSVVSLCPRMSLSLDGLFWYVHPDNLLLQRVESYTLLMGKVRKQESNIQRFRDSQSESPTKSYYRHGLLTESRCSLFILVFLVVGVVVFEASEARPFQFTCPSF